MTARRTRVRSLFLAISFLPLFGLLLSACDMGGGQGGQSKTISSAANQAITYSTNAQDVVIRTFYGGGLYGSFALAPQLSIYGDGSYILGLDRQGQLSADELQQLLKTLVDTYGLLNFKRAQLQFADMPDQNATFLELSLNGKQQEFMYGSFGNQQESTQDMDEYQRLGKALTTLTETLNKPTHPYTGTADALLVRQTFNPDLAHVQRLTLPDFTLSQAAFYECGLVPEDKTSLNKEIGCLKYTIPINAVLLTANGIQAVKDHLGNQQQGTFIEEGAYYEVTLRPLLPDEQAKKTLALFGSAQDGYKAIPLHEGALPPVPTPTPAA